LLIKSFDNNKKGFQVKNKIIIGVYLFAFINIAQAAMPCSGKKMGVSQCAQNGDFICNDGSVSKSKKVCVNNTNWAEPVVKYRAQKTKKANLVRRDL